MPVRPPVEIPGYEPGGDDGDSSPGEEPLTFEELASILTREPFNLAIAQVARLNDYQLYHVYLRPRDEHGLLIRPQRGWDEEGEGEFEAVTFKEMFEGVCRLRGWDEEQTAAAWEHYLEENPGLREQAEEVS